MAEHIIPLEDYTKAKIINTGGDLYLTGWNKDEIRIKDLTDQDQVNKKKNQLQMQFSGDAIIHIPHSLEITVDAVGGDASVRQSLT